MTLNDGEPEDDGNQGTPHCMAGANAAASTSALQSTLRDRNGISKSKSLQGISDLTLIAPFKNGLISALDTRTYATRARLLMKSLHSLRVTSREYSPLRPFVDTAASIRTILSFRLAIIGDGLMLAVTFDRPWEPYIRSIWNDVGPLLDVIFCNCEGYTVSTQHSFEEYMRWVRSVQAETGFFFATNSMTVDDLQYISQVEPIYRAGEPGFELRAAQETLKSPQELAAAVLRSPANRGEVLTQGMLALSALYRLVDLYTPQADGDVLLRAAHELLKGLPTADLPPPVRARFAAQLNWFEQPLPKPPRPTLGLVEVQVCDVQAGILSELRDTHSCLLLFAIDDALLAAQFLHALRARITTEANPGAGPHLNLALTYEGLCQLGLHASQLEKFAAEFREGMQARAGLLGDIRCNHPRNWRLPLRNWPMPPAPDSVMPRVELSMVHVVIRLGCADSSAAANHPVEHPIHDARHPLHAHIAELARLAQGLSLLSVEAATRREPGHFGYTDGLSQPLVNKAPVPGSAWPNDVPLGDVLLGHPNRFDFAQRDPLLDNGSYLVVRKLSQDTQFFHEQMQRESLRLQIPADELKAKLMGRTLSGVPLVNPAAAASNDFNYEQDAQGTLCPFAAHARRANPRIAGTPRIIRRGMSYGPVFDPAKPVPAERGLYFLAYNASIAEQFEVLQRWMTGGNSTGVYSGEADPLLGVPEAGQSRNFRFQHRSGDEIKPLHIKLTDATARPLVKLEWGLYLFVPSLTGLAALIGHARRVRDVPDSAAGEEVVQRLLRQDRKLGRNAFEHWKAVLEDSESRLRGIAANVWAAIREHHHGVLRTSFGVLVCSRELVLEVFANSHHRYSATGYLKRMEVSLGRIYLGKDAGADYDREGKQINAAIQGITGQEAFDSAYRHTRGAVAGFIEGSQQLSAQAGQKEWELTLDIKELADAVLAKLSAEWFDIPDGKHIQSGGWRWDWQPDSAPLCPGHFTAPSRFTFQPHPGDGPRRYAMLHGQSLRSAMNRFVSEKRANPDALQGRLVRAMFAALPDKKDNDLLARNLVGVMMGFLPSVDGNLRGTLYEWIEHRTLWEVQQAYLSHSAASKFQQALATILQPLMNTMRLRPVPELVWRTARVRHHLGRVEVKPRDLVVLAIVSATQEDRLRGTAHDVYPIFGGNRRAAPERPHACPAYDSGMGVMLGILAGLLDSGPMRPTPASLTLSFSGRLDPTQSTTA